MQFLADIGKPFIPTWTSGSGYGLSPFAVELILIATIVAVLLTPFFTTRSNWMSALVAMAGLLAALVAVVILAFQPPAGPQFRGMLISDPYAVLWKAMLLLFTAGVVLMWLVTTASTMHEGDGPEFFTLLLGATLGMCLMASTSNLLMIFMAVELASLPSYVLSGFRKTDRIGSEASLKYVLFGAATSAVMAYGMSMLYGLYGTLQIEELATRIPHTAVGAAAVPLIVGVAGLIVGIGFKISAVPLHFWCPDVFQGAGIEVSTFLSVASKGAGISLLLRIVMSLASGMDFDPGAGFLTGTAIVIGVLGALTATVGNVGALVQNNIKRLLAYSSIAHAGYILCALALLVAWTRDIDLATQVPQTVLLYLAVYLFMNLGAFTVAGLIWRETGSEDIRDYAGLGRRSPVLAACMLAFMLSLIGLPPFAGFLAKLKVMLVLGAAGGWFWALVAVIGINTIISLYFYARVLRQMYLIDTGQPPVETGPIGTMIATGCATMLVIMLVGASPLLSLTGKYGRMHLPSKQPAAQAALDKTMAAVQE